MNFKNRVAIVTGSAEGIGQAIAEYLASMGAKVVVNDMNAEFAEKVAEGIRAAGGEAAACVEAVGTGQAAKKIVACAVKNFGTLDILVNNAGIDGDSPLLEMEEDHIRKSLDVNLIGGMLLCKEACAIMAEKKYGKIVNFTSRNGLRGKAGYTALSAGRMGVVGLTLTLSEEMAPYSVNVNCIAPAAWTRMLEEMPEPSRSRTIERRKNNVLNRIAKPADVAPTVAFLVSDEAQYLTGQIIGVTGQQMALL